MTKKILVAALFISAFSMIADAVAVRTSCGIWTYTIDQATYEANVGGSYEQYLREVNFANCNTYDKPEVFQEGGIPVPIL